MRKRGTAKTPFGIRWHSPPYRCRASILRLLNLRLEPEDRIALKNDLRANRDFTRRAHLYKPQTVDFKGQLRCDTGRTGLAIDRARASKSDCIAAS